MGKRQGNPFRLNPELEKKAVKQAATMAWNNCNFLAGTVCPAPIKGDDFESLEAAFEMFDNIDSDMDLIVQVKHMGSRAQLYLARDRDACYATTRNGFKLEPREGEPLTREELEENYRRIGTGADYHPNEISERWIKISEAIDEKWEEYYDKESFVYDTTDLIVLDTELMPWSLIGKDLIEKDFYGYSIAHRHEISLAVQYGFHEVTGSRDEKQYDGFVKEISEFSRDIVAFEDQVDIFGASHDKAEFRPFNILKFVRNDGTEKVCVDNNLHNYELVGDAPYAVVKAGSWHESEDLVKLLKHVEENKLEGVVIKPAKRPEAPNGVPPYIKVRNKEYLRIIYGADYQRPGRIKKLLRGKNIGDKLTASINQYHMGITLLNIPHVVAHQNNEDYFEKLKDITRQVVFDDENLDPCL